MKRTLHSMLILSALALLCALTALPAAADNARTVDQSDVKRILDAPKKQSYVAHGNTQSWYKGKSISSDVKVYHKHPDKHRIEYLTPPLKGVVCVDDGHCVWRFDPKLNAIVGSEGVCPERKDRLGLMLTNYRVEEAGSTRIAGRQAKILNVKTTSGELRKRLFVDEKTHIVLLSEDYASGRKLVSKTALSSIDYDARIPDSLFDKPTKQGGMKCIQGDSRAMSYDQLSKELGFRVKVPRYVPKGYKLDAYRLVKCSCKCDHDSAYTRYTSGLGSISIFETAANSDCLKKGGCGSFSGECSVRERTAVMKSGNRIYVVIGDVSKSELKKIADSLK